jgi:hypothetical protein
VSDPSGRNQPCQTVVENVASAKTWHAAAGTPSTARAASPVASASQDDDPHRLLADDSDVPATEGRTSMSFLTHAVFSIMLLLSLLAGFWSYQRQAE